MKKLLLLLVLFTGMVNAQINLGVPTTYYTCSTFDLTTKNAEILALNSPSFYSIAYFETQVDASTNNNVIQNPTSYANYSAFISVVFARVWQNSNPANFVTTSLGLDRSIIYRYNEYESLNIGIQDIPFDGFYTFDLTTNTPGILLNNPNCVVAYYPSETDALNDTNSIANPDAYTNVINASQEIGYRITSTIIGCYQTGKFNIVAVNEPILNFPDPIFKYKLLYPELAIGINNSSIYFDINNDGEIEVSEALSVHELTLGDFEFANSFPPYITNMSGIENFTNLTFLDCSGNQITSLDVSALVNLKRLECEYNQISSINVNGLVNLEYLYANVNNLTSINVSGLSGLEQLACAGNQLTTIDISSLSNLKSLIIYANQISSIDITGLQNFSYLDIANNLFTTLDVSASTSLKNLICDNNQIANLNLGTNNLGLFRCSNNSISVLDLSQCTDLTLLECRNNLLTTLDVRQAFNIFWLQCEINLLTSLYMKTGEVPFSSLEFYGNQNLNYICTDNNKIAIVQSKLLEYGNTNCSVTSYCTFIPGGLYNTITGITNNDINNNGCDASDLPQPNIRVNINDGTNQGATFSNNSGDYNFYTQAGSFAITPEVENPTWFSFSPTTATIPFANNNNNTATQDFCITPNGIHPDLEVVLAPITPARPGFDATYQLVYKNKGNQTLNGVLSFNYDVFRLLFISSNTTPDFNFEGTIDWNFTNLLPFESRSIAVTLNVNSPVETPAVNIGDVLNFTTSITPIVGDELPADNTFVYNQTVVGSFDPNDITCLEGNSVAPSEIGEYLHYVINFENTGNFPAENVVVKTIVDPAKFDINSLQLLNTSAPVDARITGNVVEFIFKNVQLAGPGGHGHVLLKIKSKSTLVTGDNVAKSAGIYFDYNAPVDTGMATTVFQSLSNAVFEKDDSINVSPNPTNGNVNVNSNFNIKMIEMYDVQGRIIETHIGETKTLDISEKANGIYFLKITTQKGSKIEKVVKK